MLGNALEWVTDCYRATYKDAPADGSAFVNSDCGKPVLRGGTRANWPSFNRGAHRDSDEPSDRALGYGFRLARALD